MRPFANKWQRVMRLLQQDRQNIALSAVADADSRALYWFVDDAYVGGTRPGETIYWKPPAAGDYRVRTVDDHGRSDKRQLDVKLEQ